MFFSPVGGSTAQGRGTKFREPTGQRITAGDSAVALELDKSSSRHRADWTAPAGDFACGDQPVRLDCGRCGAPAPYYFYKYGKLVLRMFYFSFLKSAFDLEIKSGQEKESQQG